MPAHDEQRIRASHGDMIACRWLAGPIPRPVCGHTTHNTAKRPCGEPYSRPGTAAAGRLALPDPGEDGLGRAQRRQVLAIAPGPASTLVVLALAAGGADHICEGIANTAFIHRLDSGAGTQARP